MSCTVAPLRKLSKVLEYTSHSVPVDKGHYTAVNAGQLRRNVHHALKSTIPTNSGWLISDETHSAAEATHF